MASRRLASATFLVSTLCVSAWAQTAATAGPHRPGCRQPQPSAAAAPPAARRFRPSMSPPRTPSRAPTRSKPAPGRGAKRSGDPRAAVALPDRRSQHCRRRAGSAAVGEPDDVFRRRSQRSSDHPARRNPRSGARPGGGRCMPTAARPISITCAATISITAPTWPPMSTTCRSICRPTRMARAIPTSTGSFRKPSAAWTSARGRISPTSATSPAPATCTCRCATASSRTSSR